MSKNTQLQLGCKQHPWGARGSAAWALPENSPPRPVVTAGAACVSAAFGFQGTTEDRALLPLPTLDCTVQWLLGHHTLRFSMQGVLIRPCVFFIGISQSVFGWFAFLSVMLKSVWYYLKVLTTQPSPAVPCTSPPVDTGLYYCLLCHCSLPH